MPIFLRYGNCFQFPKLQTVLSNPLSTKHPQAIEIRIIHNSTGDVIQSIKWPKNHLIPSLLSILCIGNSKLTDVIIHDKNTNNTCNATSTNAV